MYHGSTEEKARIISWEIQWGWLCLTAAGFLEEMSFDLYIEVWVDFNKKKQEGYRSDDGKTGWRGHL